MKIEYLHETKYGNGTMVAAPVRAADGWQPAKTPARRNGRADTNRATRGLRCARAIRIVIIGSRDPSARDARRQIISFFDHHLTCQGASETGASA